MPLLEITQTRQISASVRLDEVTATQVDQYAAFIHASADDVVDKALNYVFSKDRDFQDFLKTPQSNNVTSTLRIRKAVVNEPPEQPAKKPVASHRVIIDTPSLQGSCWVSAGIPGKDRTTSTTCASQEFLRIPRYPQEFPSNGR